MYALDNLAAARLGLDDFDGAQQAALAALRLGRYRDATIGAASRLFVATAAALQGRPRGAARLLGYVDAWALLGYRWDTTEAGIRERLVDALNVQLEAETLCADIAVGARLDEDAAVEEALRA